MPANNNDVGVATALVIPETTLEGLERAQSALEGMNAAADGIAAKFSGIVSEASNMQDAINGIHFPREVEVRLVNQSGFLDDLNRLAGAIDKISSSNVVMQSTEKVASEARRQMDSENTLFEKMDRAIMRNSKTYSEIMQAIAILEKVRSQINRKNEFEWTSEESDRFDRAGRAIDLYRQRLEKLGLVFRSQAASDDFYNMLAIPTDSLDDCARRLESIARLKEEAGKPSRDSSGQEFEQQARYLEMLEIEYGRTTAAQKSLVEAQQAAASAKEPLNRYNRIKELNDREITSYRQLKETIAELIQLRDAAAASGNAAAINKSSVQQANKSISELMSKLREAEYDSIKVGKALSDAMRMPENDIYRLQAKMETLVLLRDEFSKPAGDSRNAFTIKQEQLKNLEDQIQSTKDAMVLLRQDDLSKALLLPENTVEDVKAKIKAISDAMKSLKAESKGTGVDFSAEFRDADDKLTSLSEDLKNKSDIIVRDETAVSRKIADIVAKRYSTYQQYVTSIQQLKQIEADALSAKISGNLSSPQAEADAQQTADAARTAYTELQATLDATGLAFDRIAAAKALSDARLMDTSSIENCREKLVALKEAEQLYSKPGGTVKDLAVKRQAMQDLAAEAQRTREQMVDLARNELNNLLSQRPGKGIEEAKRRYKELVDALQQLKSVARGSGVDVSQALLTGTQEADRLRDALERCRGELRNVSRSAGELGGYLSSAFSLMALTGYVRKMVRVRGEFEMVEASLKVILKDANRARSIFNEMQIMAVKSPYTLQELSAQAKQLAAYRIEADQLLPTIKNLGDVASGTGVEMNRLILAYGQVRAAQFLKGCLGFGTPVLLFSGEIVPVETVREGDSLMGDDGTPRTVRQLIRGRELMYIVKYEGGTYRVNAGHILTMWNIRHHRLEDIHVTDYLRRPDDYMGVRRTSGGMAPYPVVVKSDIVDDYYGFVIDGNRRFCLGDGTITHNTELRQFTEAGVDMLGGLADRFTEIYNRAVSVGEVMKMISNRQVLFSDVKAVIEGMTAAGGTFYQMQEKQAETVKGMLSNIEDRLSIMFNDIGKSTEGTVKNIIQGLNWILGQTALVGGAIGAAFSYKVVASLVRYLLSVNATLGTIRGQYAAILAEETLINMRTRTAAALTAAWRTAAAPIVGIIAAIGASIAIAATNASRIRKELETIGSEGAAETSKLIFRYEQLSAVAGDANKPMAERRKALEDLNTEYGNLLPRQGLEIEQIDNLSNLYEGHVTLIRQYVAEKTKQAQIEAVLQDTQKKESKRVTAAAQAWKQEIDLLLERNKVIRSQTNAATLTEQHITSILKEIEQASVSGQITSENDALMMFISRLDEAASAGGILAGTIKKIREQVDGKSVGEQRFDSLIRPFLKAYETISSIQDVVKAGIPQQFKDVDEAIKDMGASFAKFKNDLKETDPKYSENSALLDIDAEKKFLSEYKEEVDRMIEGAVKAFNTDKVSAWIGDNFSRETYRKLVEEFDRVADQIANGGTVDGIVASMLPVARKIADRCPQALAMALDTMNLADDVKGAILKAMGLGDVDVNDMAAYVVTSDASNGLNTIGYQQGQMYMESFNKGAASITSDSLTLMLLQEYAKAIDKYGESMADSTLFAMQEGETIEQYVQGIRKRIDELTVSIAKHNAMLGTNEAAVVGITEQTVAQEEAYLAQAKALIALFPTIDRYNQKQSEVTKALNEQKKSLKDLASHVVDYNKEMEDMAPVTRKMAEDVIESLSRKARTSAPASFDTVSVRKWLEGLNTSLIDEDVVLELGVKLTENDMDNQLKRLKKQLEKKWSDYDFALSLEDMGLSLDEYDTKAILADIMEIEKAMSDIGTNRSVEAAQQSSDKRLDIYRKETQTALKIAQDANRKALSDTQRILTDAYSNINDMIRGLSPSDVLNEEIKRGIRGSLDTALDEIQKASYENFKSSEMYVAAFSNLGGMDTAALDSIKSKLLTLQNLERLSPADAKAIANAIADINEAMSMNETAGEGWLSYLTAGIDQMRRARDEYEKLPGLSMEYAEAQIEEEGMLKAVTVATEELYAAQIALVEARESGTDEDQASAAALVEERTAALTQATGEYEAAQNRASAAGARYTRTLQSVKNLTASAIGRFTQLKQKVSGLVGVIEDGIGLIEDFGDAFGLAMGDDARDIMNSFTKGMRLVISALSMGEVVMGLFARETEVATASVYALETACWPLLAAAAAIGAIAAIVTASDKKIQREIDSQQKVVDALTEAYERLEQTVDAVLSRDTLTSSLKEQTSNLELQRRALEQMIALERSRGSKADKDAIEDYRNQLKALDEQQKQALDTFYERLGVNNDWASQAEGWASSWLDAFKSTGDGLEALQEGFDELFDSIIAQQVNLVVMGPFIDKLKDTVYRILEDGRITQDEMGEISQLRGEMSDLNERMKDYLDRLGFAAVTGYDTESLQKGIQSVTETTAQALESLLNSMRFFVADTSADVRSILAVLTGQGDFPNPLLLELKAQTSLLQGIRDSLSDVIMGGHSSGGFGVKVFLD